MSNAEDFKAAVNNANITSITLGGNIDLSSVEGTTKWGDGGPGETNNGRIDILRNMTLDVGAYTLNLGARKLVFGNDMAADEHTYKIEGTGAITSSSTWGTILVQQFKNNSFSCTADVTNTNSEHSKKAYFAAIMYVIEDDILDAIGGAAQAWNLSEIKGTLTCEAGAPLAIQVENRTTAALSVSGIVADGKAYITIGAEATTSVAADSIAVTLPNGYNTGSKYGSYTNSITTSEFTTSVKATESAKDGGLFFLFDNGTGQEGASIVMTAGGFKDAVNDSRIESITLGADINLSTDQTTDKWGDGGPNEFNNSRIDILRNMTLDVGAYNLNLGARKLVFGNDSTVEAHTYEIKGSGTITSTSTWGTILVQQFKNNTFSCAADVTNTNGEHSKKAYFAAIMYVIEDDILDAIGGAAQAWNLSEIKGTLTCEAGAPLAIQVENRTTAALSVSGIVANGKAYITKGNTATTSVDDDSIAVTLPNGYKTGSKYGSYNSSLTSDGFNSSVTATESAINGGLFFLFAAENNP